MDTAAIIALSRAISMIGAIIIDQLNKMPEAERPIPVEEFEAKLAGFKQLADLPTNPT